MGILSVTEIASFYRNAGLEVISKWNLSRKHIRIETMNHKFMKLNKFENRLNTRELQKYCVKYKPLHVYMSVLDWLFPERVGKKYKGQYARPVGGEYAVDVDSYVSRKRHHHFFYSDIREICFECIEIARQATIQACEKIEEYYSDIAIVFSGKRGFHIHVFDFNVNHWTYYNHKNPIKSHEVARFKFTKKLVHDTFVFDRNHFILSVDPMRVLAIPNSLNAETGLICFHIGNRKDLEARSVHDIIESSNPALFVYGRPEPLLAMKTPRRAKNMGGEH